MRTNLKIMKIIFLLFWMYSCQDYPMQEIGRLGSILDSTLMEKVHIRYPEEFNSLKDSINTVLEKIESERSKLAFRKYDQYTNQLSDLTKEINYLRENNSR